MQQPFLPPLAAPIVADAEADVGRYYVFVEELYRGGNGVVRQFLSADFVEHGSAGDCRGEDLVARVALRRARFPDAVWTIELLVGVGGLVLCHTTMSAPGLLAGSTWETTVVRFADGKIAEAWRLCGDRALAE